jgi:hypothetical protein
LLQQVTPLPGTLSSPASILRSRLPALNALTCLQAY